MHVQLLIAGPVVDDQVDPMDPLALETHSKALDAIEKLGRVWDQAVQRLSKLAADAYDGARSTTFELETIEFHLGIEAGLNVGFVSKGDASVSLTFQRQRKQEPSAGE